MVIIQLRPPLITARRILPRGESGSLSVEKIGLPSSHLILARTECDGIVTVTRQLPREASQIEAETFWSKHSGERPDLISYPHRCYSTRALRETSRSLVIQLMPLSMSHCSWSTSTGALASKSTSSILLHFAVGCRNRSTPPPRCTVSMLRGWRPSPLPLPLPLPRCPQRIPIGRLSNDGRSLILGQLNLENSSSAYPTSAVSHPN